MRTKTFQEDYELFLKYIKSINEMRLFEKDR